jgi:hypothetical protein
MLIKGKLMDKSKLFIIPVLLTAAFLGWFQGQHSTKDKAAKNIEPEAFEVPVDNSKKNPSIVTSQDNHSKAAQKKDVEVPENQTNEITFMSKEELEAKAERLKQAYRDNPNFDSSLAKREKFESESIIEEWAAPREKALHDAFKLEPHLQGKNLKSIQCRSRYCRVEIFFDAPQNINDIVDDVYSISSSGKYESLFVNSADMGVALQEKVLSVYFTSDLRASLF